MGRPVRAGALLMVLFLLAGRLTTVSWADAESDRAIGAAAERRFPPLVVPTGFKATLFACDPLVEYPSVIAIGPELGTLFVAHDYLTGLGVEIVRRDEIRLLRDADHDGYADESELYATGFNSIQGLAYHDGSVFVMHAPQLTMLQDTDGDGAADVRQTLIDGLGLPPEENDNRLHCANGVVVGYDGWLYLALGDRGCNVKRPEGDRLLFQEGGILRCRPDGSDLHVFATGLRNIYDIVLDAELNVFVRDNENDGGDYMIRVCHSFHGADHGYPYLYRERPDEALHPLADLGRGSSAGGTAYLETAFPREYRRSLFFCEWGRAVVRYEKQADNGYFKTMSETDFAAGSASDPYGFRPTDLVVDYDGSLLVSDWGDGQRPKRGRGRIYRISVAEHESASIAPTTAETPHVRLMELLNSTSYQQRWIAQTSIQDRINQGGSDGLELLRLVETSLKNQSLSPLGRMHGVWIAARSEDDSTIDLLLNVARRDSDQRVRVQAIRALADLGDPDLAQHRLSAGQGDQQLASCIADLPVSFDSPESLEVLIALGRLRWTNAADWLAQNWKGRTAAHAHAAMQMLRRAGDWAATLSLLDRRNNQLSNSMDVRTIALRAVADVQESTIADGIIKRLHEESDPGRRQEYVDVLARVYKQPAPWEYWGFRPEPRPANSVRWERTAAIEDALGGALADSRQSVRMTALERMSRESIPTPLEALADWLKIEKELVHVEAILAALARHPAERVRPLLLELVGSPARNEQIRLAAVKQLESSLTSHNQEEVIDLVHKVEDGPVLAAVLEAFGVRSAIVGNQLLLEKLTSRAPEVRVAALTALGKRGASEAASRVVGALDDDDPRVRRAAAAVAGQLNVTDATASLLKFAATDDGQLVRASLESLLELKAPGAVSLAINQLHQPETQVAALNYMREFAAPRQLDAITEVAMRNRSIDVLQAVASVLLRWLENAQLTQKERQEIFAAVARIHGHLGAPVLWTTLGPLNDAEIQTALEVAGRADAELSDAAKFVGWRHTLADGIDSAVQLSSANGPQEGNAWFALFDLFSPSNEQVQFSGSADGVLQAWLNGETIFQREESASFRPGRDQFEGPVSAGTNRLLLRITSEAKTPRVHVRFRGKASKPEHERLTRFLLEGDGDVQRGARLFAQAEKSSCIKCHQIGDEGGRVGPDLTGIGSRFSRIHLIESILQPSRTIAPSYATTTVLLESGKALSGVKVAETADTITLGDQEGKLQTIPRSKIEQSHGDAMSIMPEGLEKGMADRELLDLLEFLVAQKVTPD